MMINQIKKTISNLTYDILCLGKQPKQLHVLPKKKVEAYTKPKHFRDQNKNFLEERKRTDTKEK